VWNPQDAVAASGGNIAIINGNFSDFNAFESDVVSFSPV